MSLSMYQASVPPLLRTLKNLRGVLAKGQAHAEARGFDPVVLVQARLYPDMLPLSRQVQIATDTAKGCAARLAGVDVPSYADTESDFPQLLERIDRTRAFLKSFKAEQIDGSEQRRIVLAMRRGKLEFDGQTYLHSFVLPNVYFHVTTAYNILRHNGVEIGKQDYLGAN